MKSKVVVVSLKDAEWRRKVISTQLNAMGVEYEFFDALDYRNADVKDLLSSKEIEDFHARGGYEVTPPKVGNYRSIWTVMKMALDRGDESVVICEDDAFFSPVFADVVEAIEQLDNEINLVSLGALWLFGVGFGARAVPMPRYGDSYQSLPHGRKVFQCPIIAMGCQGVFVRRNWIQDNLEAMAWYDMPIDWKLFGGKPHAGGWGSLTPFWSLNMGGDIVYQGVGGDSYSEGQSLTSRQPPPLPIPFWHTPATHRLMESWITLRLRLSR